MYDDFFSKAHELLSQGLPFATAIVVRAEKPTSARPGDKAIVTPDGLMSGWIGGSCAQPTVIREALKALAGGEPRFIRLSPDPDSQRPRQGLVDLPLTCFSGGTLEIHIEPHLPPPRLMIVGHLPVAQALARLGRAMNYHLIAVDPDNEGAGLAEVDEVVTNLKHIPDRITPLTYVVVASHGHYDEIALEYALRSAAAYVALVASKARAGEVLNYLAGQGLTEAELARLKYPAGLDIQALRGDEIALSIMAEIVQRRRNAEPLDVAALVAQSQAAEEPSPSDEALSEVSLLPERTPAAEATEAIDPVCGMTVQIAAAHHRTEYDGQTFYFCCAGCLTAFTNEPEKYLDRPAPAGEALDPVCGMTVDIAGAKYMSEHEGHFYYFCGPGCKTSFDKAPQDYVKAAASE